MPPTSRTASPTPEPATEPPAAAAALPAPTTTTETVRRLRSMIAAGQLVAGQALLEVELAQRLTVSRPTLREALRELETEGLAVRSRARGLAVRRLTRRDVSDLYDIREALEALAARRAAERVATSANAERSAYELQRVFWAEAAASGQVIAFSEANRRLHAQIIATAGNAHLPHLLDRTLIDLFAAQLRGWIAPPKVQQSAREHVEILDALLAGDGRAAERAMRHHVRASAQAILALPDEAF